MLNSTPAASSTVRMAAKPSRDRSRDDIFMIRYSFSYAQTNAAVVPARPARRSRDHPNSNRAIHICRGVIGRDCINQSETLPSLISMNGNVNWLTMLWVIGKHLYHTLRG